MKKILLLVITSISFQLFSQCASTCDYIGSSSNNAGTSTAVTISIPSGVVANDIMIAAIHSGWCISDSAVAPAGWIRIAHTENISSGCGFSGGNYHLSTFYKIATASEPANYTFTGNTSQIYVGGIVAYRGVDLLNPINALSSNPTQEWCDSIIASSVTTTSTCTRLVGVFFASVNWWGTNLIPPASMTERVDVGNTGNHPWGNENVMIADESMVSAGTTGVRLASLTGGSGDGWPTGAQLIALKCGNGSSTSLTIDAFPSSICAGTTFNVNYTASGFTSGNIFSLELSDAAGSFASPVLIGSLTSTSSSVITGTIPSSTPSGTNYKVRINSSSPAGIIDESGFITITNLNAIASAPDSLCVGDNLLFSSTGGTTYAWTGPNSFTSSLQNPSIMGVTTAASGTYTVVASSGGCTDTAMVTVVVENCNSFLENNSIGVHSIYPNPTNGIFEITLAKIPTTNTQLEIVDCLGKVILSKPVTELTTMVNISNITKGIYFVRLWNNKGTVTQKIILK